MQNSNKKDKVITMGEIMLRLTAPYYNRLDQTESFLANYGGGEANVAVSLAHFGHGCYFVSRLPNNELGDGAIKHLKGNDVDTSYIIRDSSLMGMYFLENGFGGRPGKVIYNRAHSSASKMNAADYDFDEIFQGADWFHISGITLALSDATRDTAIIALQYAKKHNVKISFDFNYRSMLLTLEQASKIYSQVMPYADIVFASPYDFKEILHMNAALTDDELFAAALEKYNLKYIFGKSRQIISAGQQSMKGYVYYKGGKEETKEITFEIYDRIGAGDAYASGVIHSLLKDFSRPGYAAEFGIVNSILKQTIYGDASIFSENDVLEYIEKSGKEEVKR